MKEIGIFKEANKIIAIGDLHGDIIQLISILKKANLIEYKYKEKCINISDYNPDNWIWIGKDTNVVQMGDIFDGGGRSLEDIFNDNEVEILIFLIKMKKKAKKDKGNIFILFGNHELMNFNRDYRYVQKNSMDKCLNMNNNLLNIEYKTKNVKCNHRDKLFELGKGPLAHLMYKYCYGIIKIGNNIFCHGGLSLKLAKKYSITKINLLLKKFLMNKLNQSELINFNEIYGNQGIVWYREYIKNSSLCNDLKKTLDILKSKRMIVGHTVQINGINAKCQKMNNLLWAIDVGLSRAFQTKIKGEYLEIKSNKDNDIVKTKVYYLLKECKN
tara:strand:+ start:264 stop:1247 length:984 start_codon:yes stop_codon:yes gene_type:complete